MYFITWARCDGYPAGLGVNIINSLFTSFDRCEKLINLTKSAEPFENEKTSPPSQFDLWNSKFWKSKTKPNLDGNFKFIYTINLDSNTFSVDNDLDPPHRIHLIHTFNEISNRSICRKITENLLSYSLENVIEQKIRLR